MPRTSKTKTIEYKYPDGSTWTFRGEKGDGDDNAIADMTSKTILGKISAEDIRHARRRGQDIGDLVMDRTTQETIMSVKTATLLHMSISWNGPEFLVPKDEKDPENPKKTHPLAGLVAPLTAEWIERGSPDDNADVLRYLEVHWAAATRSAQDEQDFPESGSSVDGPDGSGTARA